MIIHGLFPPFFKITILTLPITNRKNQDLIDLFVIITPNLNFIAK